MKFEEIFSEKEIRRGCSKWPEIRRLILSGLSGLTLAILYTYIIDPIGFNNLIIYYIG